MKVLHLVKTSDGAGWALRQMKELVKAGVEVHVAMPGNGFWMPEYISAGITVHEMNFSLKHIYTSCKQLRKIVKEVSPDIIHSHFVLTTLIMRLALRNDSRPRIFQVPGPLHLENWFFRNLDIYIARKNDFWVGSCKWTNKRYAASGVSGDRIFLSYYGGELKKMASRKLEIPHKIRTELNLGKDAIIIGMVAYMYAPKRYLGQTRGLKGHEDFIDAIAIVSAKYPQVYGVCIGGAWGNARKYEQQVIDYARKRTDHVYFMGTRTDVLDLYSDMFCVVHPSLSENLGGAGESLTLGVPTIATNIGGFPDIVVDGQTGVLVPPRSPEAIAQAIIDFIEGKYDRNKMSQQGIRLMSETFDLQHTTSSLIKIYNQLIR